MDSNIKSFDGTSDVKVFLEKVTIHWSLKGYEDEKCAQNIASRLVGRSFDVYLRLADIDKKNPEKIKEELLREFERGKQDRELAIHELTNRMRNADESAETFAYTIQELVALAYPTFDVETRNTISKDYFVKGLNSKMQIALKSLPDFNSAKSLQQDHCMSVNPDRLADTITAKLLEKIQGISLNNPGGNNRYSRPSGSRGFAGGRNFRGRYQGNRSPCKCRSCQSPGHFVRECPTRFCQSFGAQGHDAWNPTCPKYQ